MITIIRSAKKNNCIMKQACRLQCPHFTEKETKAQKSRVQQQAKGQAGLKVSFSGPKAQIPQGPLGLPMELQPPQKNSDPEALISV